MLFAQSTKCNAGIFLYGDYYDLKTIYSTIHYLSKSFSSEESLFNFVLELAYDIRKAYEMQRDIIELGYDQYDKVSYRGVQLLWPKYLLQIGHLRWAASFLPTDKQHQRDLYSLECCAEMALKSVNMNIATQIMDWLQYSGGSIQGYFYEYYRHIEHEYTSSTGKKRFNRLYPLLQSTFPISKEYRSFIQKITEQAKILDCPPEQVEINYPEINFRW